MCKIYCLCKKNMQQLLFPTPLENERLEPKKSPQFQRNSHLPSTSIFCIFWGSSRSFSKCVCKPLFLLMIFVKSRSADANPSHPRGFLFDLGNRVRSPWTCGGIGVRPSHRHENSSLSDCLVWGVRDVRLKCVIQVYLLGQWPNLATTFISGSIG